MQAAQIPHVVISDFSLHTRFPGKTSLTAFRRPGAAPRPVRFGQEYAPLGGHPRDRSPTTAARSWLNPMAVYLPDGRQESSDGGINAYSTWRTCPAATGGDYLAYWFPEWREPYHRKNCTALKGFVTTAPCTCPGPRRSTARARASGAGAL